jgi:hypothetical protein
MVDQVTELTEGTLIKVDWRNYQRWYKLLRDAPAGTRLRLVNHDWVVTKEKDGWLGFWIGPDGTGYNHAILLSEKYKKPRSIYEVLPRK